MTTQPPEDIKNEIKRIIGPHFLNCGLSDKKLIIDAYFKYGLGLKEYEDKAKGFLRCRSCIVKVFRFWKKELRNENTTDKSKTLS